MKIFKVLMIAVSAVVGAVGLSACSSDEPDTSAELKESDKYVQNGVLVPGSVNLGTFSRFASGLSEATYTRGGTTMYIKDELTDGKWEKQNLELFDGYRPFFPSTLILRGGKSWRKIEWDFGTPQFRNFSAALRAINKETEKHYEAYEVFHVSLEEETRGVNILNKYSELIEADDQKIVLATETRFEGGRTHNGGLTLEITVFSLSEPIEFNDEMVGFESRAEAYKWLIDLFRATFGESVDLNKFNDGPELTSRSVLSISDLEKERDMDVTWYDPFPSE